MELNWTRTSAPSLNRTKHANTTATLKQSEENKWRRKRPRHFDHHWGQKLHLEVRATQLPGELVLITSKTIQKQKNEMGEGHSLLAIGMQCVSLMSLMNVLRCFLAEKVGGTVCWFALAVRNFGSARAHAMRGYQNADSTAGLDHRFCMNELTYLMTRFGPSLLA